MEIVIALERPRSCSLLAYEVLPETARTTSRLFPQIERQYGKAGRVGNGIGGVPTEEVLAEMRAADPPGGSPGGHAEGSLDVIERYLVAEAAARGNDPARKVQTAAAAGRARRLAGKPRPRRQGAGDPSAPAEAALGQATLTMEDLREELPMSWRHATSGGSPAPRNRGRRDSVTFSDRLDR